MILLFLPREKIFLLPSLLFLITHPTFYHSLPLFWVSINDFELLISVFSFRKSEYLRISSWSFVPSSIDWEEAWVWCLLDPPLSLFLPPVDHYSLLLQVFTLLPLHSNVYSIFSLFTRISHLFPSLTQFHSLDDKFPFSSLRSPCFHPNYCEILSFTFLFSTSFVFIICIVC